VKLAAGYQSWRQLVFVHWPVAAAALRPLVPQPLCIDEFDGTAFVSLVAFAVEAARPVGAPRTVGLRFLETNVRTYVHLDGQDHGIYFFSLDAASLVAVVGARLSLGLPYFWAHGHQTVSGNSIEYALRRRRGPSCRLRYDIGERVGIAVGGTRDHFLIERYLLHVRRGCTLWTVRVVHPPYPLQQVNVNHLDEQLVQAAGIATRGQPPLMHFAAGVDVAVLAPRIRTI
jgi:uncharacterized protein YqjF (DUF2071 family)